MKRYVSICKLHTILEVAPSKKIRCLREKALSIQARFSVKNRAKIGPESDSERKRQEKPTKTGSGAVSGRTFSAPGPFFGDFGVPAGRQNWQKTVPEQHDAYFLTTLFRFFGVLFGRVCSGRVPDRFWRLRGPSRTRFSEILRYFFAGSAGILSWFVGFRRNVAGIHRQPPELTLRGFSGVRRSRGAN